MSLGDDTIRPVKKVLLVDVDDTLLGQLEPHATRNASMTIVDHLAIDGTIHLGRHSYFYSKPVAALGALLRTHPIEAVWCTSWLAGPPGALDRIAAMLNLDMVRRPTPEELAGGRPATQGLTPENAANHWKVQLAARLLVDPDTDLALLDDEAWTTGVAFRAHPRVTLISPTRLISSENVNQLRVWTAR